MSLRSSLPALALVLCSLLPACLVGSEKQVQTTGQYVSDTTLQEIEPGRSSDFVLQLLGEPTRRIDTGQEGEELWKWNYSKEVSQSGAVFLIVRSKRTTHEGGSVYVEFQDGEVVKTWRD